MRARKHRVFIALVAAALIVGGAGKASFVQLEYAALAHKDSLHDHHAIHKHGDEHAHHDGAAHDQKQQSSLKCCSLCVAVSSEVPAAPYIAVALISSSVFYPLDCKSEAGRLVVLDPGIPKQRA
jgi:hypothetical protein